MKDFLTALLTTAILAILVETTILVTDNPQTRYDYVKAENAPVYVRFDLNDPIYRYNDLDKTTCWVYTAKEATPTTIPIVKIVVGSYGTVCDEK